MKLGTIVNTVQQKMEGATITTGFKTLLWHTRVYPKDSGPTL
jgi:hypothetical protein